MIPGKRIVTLNSKSKFKTPIMKNNENCSNESDETKSPISETNNLKKTI